ncbi:MAG: DMT family transporter [Verrucomicrobia bacterium]|nr:DMT family transporter [Verrucomicrobiota bacterium]
MKIKHYILMVLCGLCWGPSYMFIKIAVETIPPLTLVLLRVGISTIILYGICRLQNMQISKYRQHWKHFVVLGITLNALPFCLISFAELYISSSLGGILNGLTLIFTAIFAHYFGTHERLNRKKILGIFSGLIGLVLIYLPFLFDQVKTNELGILLMVLAMVSYATGTVYARAHLTKMPGLVALTSQLIVSTLCVLPLSLFIDHPFSLPFPPLQAWVGALGLALIGTVIGFYIFYKTIQVAGATLAAFATLLIPIVSMLLGVIILHEQLTWNLYVGTALIIAGAWAVNQAIKKDKEQIA